MRQLLLPVWVYKKHITQPASEQFSPIIESLLLPPTLQGCLPDLPNVARSNYTCGEWPRAVFPSTLALQLIAAGGRARAGRARRAWAMSAGGAQPGCSGEARNAKHAGTARAEPIPVPVPVPAAPARITAAHSSQHCPGGKAQELKGTAKSETRWCVRKGSELSSSLLH